MTPEQQQQQRCRATQKLRKTLAKLVRDYRFQQHPMRDSQATLRSLEHLLERLEATPDGDLVAAQAILAEVSRVIKAEHDGA